VFRFEKAGPSDEPLYYDSSYACFIAHAYIAEELMKKPLGDVQARFTALASMTRRALEVEFPELSKSGDAPDRDFKMTFYVDMICRAGVHASLR
jgi:hypothetical protein